MGIFQYILFHVHISLRHVPIILVSYLAALETENALRRSRIEAELAASRAATELALRRSRLEAEAYAEKATKDRALERSRV